MNGFAGGAVKLGVVLAENPQIARRHAHARRVHRVLVADEILTLRDDVGPPAAAAFAVWVEAVEVASIGEGSGDDVSSGELKVGTLVSIWVNVVLTVLLCVWLQP